MLQFTNFMIFMNSLLFTQMKHPLTMGLILLLQTFLISLLIGMHLDTYWFSYILFLIFLGGLLVMYIYVTTLSSNEMFYTSINLMKILMIYLCMIFFISYFLDMSYINNTMNLEMNNLLDNNMLIKENTLSLNKLYNYPTNFITIMLILYLFLTLVISVKITNFFYGPLRPMFN